MLTGTSELALRSLVVIGLDETGEPLSPPQLAQRLRCSPTYLAKVLRSLVRAGILDSFRGAKGGALLARPPEEVTLLDVVEACQGVIVGNYCREIDVRKTPVCSFHQAMLEIHDATTGVLRRWTLADLLADPTPGATVTDLWRCKLWFEGAERHAPRRPGEAEP